MPVISISITLLVILAALYFITKIKDHSPGPLVKWTANFVLLVGIGLLLFQLARGCAKMWHRKMCSNTECISRVHEGNHQRKTDNCCSKMSGEMDDCCGNKMIKKRKKMRGEPDVIRESSIDTVDGKIIMKETEIIERKE